MKVYVHSNTNSYAQEPCMTINVIVDIGLYSKESSVAAALQLKLDPNDKDRLLEDMSFFDSKTGKLCIELYNTFISKIVSIGRSMGLDSIHAEKNQTETLEYGLSNSMYFDFCVRQKEFSSTVRVIFFLRVSDHTGYKNSRDKHSEDRMEYYTKYGIPHTEMDDDGSHGDWIHQRRKDRGNNIKVEDVNISKRNSDKGHISSDYSDIIISMDYDEIVVGNIVCRTYNQAVDRLRRHFQQYIYLETRPYTEKTVTDYVDNIQAEMTKQQFEHTWRVSDDLEETDRLNDFSIIFEEWVERDGRKPKYIYKFSIRFRYLKNADGYFMRVTVIKNGESPKDLFDVKHTDTHEKTNIFGLKKIRVELKKYILDTIHAYDVTD